jgi:hypothetical protein
VSHLEFKHHFYSAPITKRSFPCLQKVVTQRKRADEPKRLRMKPRNKRLQSQTRYSRITTTHLQPTNPVSSCPAQERKEAEKWADGAKSAKSKEDKEAKRREELARKAENARLLAEEESAAPPKVKATPKAVGKKSGKDAKPAGPGAIAADGNLEKESETAKDEPPKEIESYAATGIDNALDLLEVVTAKMDKASVGQQAAGIERHPEVSRCCHLMLHILTYSSYLSGGSRFVDSWATIHTRLM